MTIHRPSATASRHSSRDEAVDRLYWILTELDAERSVSWAEVERRAIAYEPAARDDAWSVAEGSALEAIVRASRRRVTR